MAYQLIEVSNELGIPVYLYEFNLEDKYWRYASTAFDVEHAGNTYIGISIFDDGIKQQGDVTTDAFNVTLPSSTALAQLYIGTPPSRSLFLTVRHTHHGEPQAAVCYVGEVTQANFPAPGSVQLVCLSLFESLEREGLRLGWQRTCPYAVYDQSTCKVNKALHAIPAVVIGVSGDVVTADAFGEVPEGRLNGGFIEWTNPERGSEVRGIVEHVGNQIRLLGLSDGLYYGLPLTAYPGCDQLEETCIEVFDNLPNNGAQKDMPGISPFDGNNMY